MDLSADRLRTQLAALGLGAGTTVLVHCSMRAIGWIEGGADALRDALLSLVDEDEGTLVTPTQTRSKSRSSATFLHAVEGMSEAEYLAYLKDMPGFDLHGSPVEEMGALAESVRTHPRARRSPHPVTSFAAIGRQAAAITDAHPLDCLLGKVSPLGRLAAPALGAVVLLLGVGYDKCTAFHLGETPRTSPKRWYKVKVGDKWREFKDLGHSDVDFTELGRQFEAEDPQSLTKGQVGDAECRVFTVASAVRFAAERLPGLRSVR